MDTSMDQVVSLLFNLLSLSLVDPVARGPLLGQSDTTKLRLRINTNYRSRVYIKMVYPEALDEKPIKHRREVRLKLEISVFAEPPGVDSPEYCIRVPHTKSVKRAGSPSGRTILDLKLEVLGATTGKALMSACHACSVRESSPSAGVPMVDFVAKEDLINLEKGKACIAFRFLCLPRHHGTMDTEYRYTTITIPKAITQAPAD